MDVLVVGAGPTGLVAAAELLRQGVDVRVVDRATDRLRLSRAIGVQPRTLELLASRRLADPLLRRAGVVHRVVRHARWFPPATLRLDAGVADTRFRRIVFVSQTETEDVLEGALTELGGQVERGVEVVALDQQDDHVSVRLRYADGRSGTDQARWVIGADGAGSTVRSQLGLEFAGKTYQQSFVVSDVGIVGELDPEALNIFLGPRGRGQVGFMPLGPGGAWRMLAMETRSVGDDDPPPDPAELDLLARAMTSGAVGIGRADWVSRFRIHLRRVERFRVGRVFLAGDAAHTHSPAGGQGMNTGIGDAWNLAWKVGRVAAGRAAEELLDSYQAERRPVADQILRTSDRAFQGFVSSSPVVGWLRGWLVPVLTSVVGVLPGASGRAARAFSQLEIGYPDSPVVGSGCGLEPRPGARLPDVDLGDGRRLHPLLTDPARHHLLLCSSVPTRTLEAVIDPYRELIMVVEVPAGTLGGGVVLVRPDGHVEFRTDAELTGLSEHLARVHRPG